MHKNLEARARLATLLDKMRDDEGSLCPSSLRLPFPRRLGQVGAIAHLPGALRLSGWGVFPHFASLLSSYDGVSISFAALIRGQA